ncbi:hypothetical protein TRIUR3_28467 [Triticum urartu]|uniref:Uncharacterized protein n=1 Tax=Triticum urartu TaxID=4572 RepID=M7ZYB7_TRIUA|nr:hypothetical protein TRIUR3_28467 [Triticum urartu]
MAHGLAASKRRTEGARASRGGHGSAAGLAALLREVAGDVLDAGEAENVLGRCRCRDDVGTDLVRRSSGPWRVEQL